MLAFIEVTIIKSKIKENRLININHIRQVLEYSGDENKINIDLIGTDQYLIVESSLKEFKIKINQIKKI
jgi:hypothetical protein